MNQLPLFPAEPRPNPEAEEISPEDLEATAEFWERLTETARKEREQAKPTKERNKIWHVTRKDGTGQPWTSTIAAMTADEAKAIVKETDDEFGTHHEYEAIERTGRR